MKATAWKQKSIRNSGLKLYSTDTALIPEAMVLYGKDLFHFIELYVIPRTPGEVIEQWKGLGVPFVIHAAHSLHGIKSGTGGKGKRKRALLWRDRQDRRHAWGRLDHRAWR